MAWLKALFGRANRQSPAWNRSEAGNQTQIVEGNRITIYADGPLWKFCVADADNQDDPYFSEGYHTAEMARQECMAFIRGGPSVHHSSREVREAQQEASLPGRIADESERLDALVKSVARAEAAPSIKASRIFNLKKNIRSRIRISEGIWVEAHSADREDLEKVTDQIRDHYYQLFDRVGRIKPTTE